MRGSTSWHGAKPASEVSLAHACTVRRAILGNNILGSVADHIAHVRDSGGDHASKFAFTDNPDSTFALKLTSHWHHGLRQGPNSPRV